MDRRANQVNYKYSLALLRGLLGLTGALGVPFYIEIVDSEGDSSGRRNRSVEDPFNNYEALSFGAGGSIAMQPEGGIPCSYHGEWARP